MILEAKLWDAAHLQQSFRSLMDAFSYPGELRALGRVGAYNAAEQVLACLVDGQVTLFQDGILLDESFLRFLRARLASPSDADFLLLKGVLFRSDLNPSLGSLGSPEKAATLILKVEGFTLEEGTIFDISGPGIPGSKQIAISGLDSEWIVSRNEWCAHVPLGVDLIFVSEDTIMAIPRSTTVKQVKG